MLISKKIILVFESIKKVHFLNVSIIKYVYYVSHESSWKQPDHIGIFWTSFYRRRIYNVGLPSLNGIFYFCRLGFTIEKIPASGFHLSEEKSQQLAFSVASLWNTSINDLKSLCKGNDWMLFAKVFTILCCLLTFNAWSLMYIVLNKLRTLHVSGACSRGPQNNFFNIYHRCYPEHKNNVRHLP